MLQPRSIYLCSWALLAATAAAGWAEAQPAEAQPAEAQPGESRPLQAQPTHTPPPGQPPAQAPPAESPPPHAYRLPPPNVPPPPPVGVTRRPVELIPGLGLSVPGCAAGDDGDDRCRRVQAGGSFEFSALWRVTPHWAWGGGFDISAFRYEEPEGGELTDTQAGAAWIGLLGRWYVLDETSVDPYVQFGLGGGALGTTGTVPTGEKYEETGAGPALQIGGGFDFILGSRVKLGPALAYTHVFVDKIRRCRAGGEEDCHDVGKDAGYLSGFLVLSARLTIMIGDEL